jgi:hypothetical protein
MSAEEVAPTASRPFANRGSRRCRARQARARTPVRNRSAGQAISSRQGDRLTHELPRRPSLNHTDTRPLGGRRQAGQRQEPEHSGGARHKGGSHWENRMKSEHGRRSNLGFRRGGLSVERHQTLEDRFMS